MSSLLFLLVIAAIFWALNKGGLVNDQQLTIQGKQPKKQTNMNRSVASASSVALPAPPELISSYQWGLHWMRSWGEMHVGGSCKLDGTDWTQCHFFSTFLIHLISQWVQTLITQEGSIHQACSNTNTQVSWLNVFHTTPQCHLETRVPLHII